MPEDLGPWVELVRRGGVVVLSGAGLSTESGIPDYRGPDGLRRVTPMQYGEFVSSGAARQRYWARSYVGWARLASAGPNDGHRAVAALERLGAVDLVITQNVDGLHQRAGTREVVELHGSLAEVVCLRCGDRTSRVDLDRRMRDANPSYEVRTNEIRPDGDISLDDLDVAGFVAPRCLACGDDMLKPDVVFFGESVPRARVDRCLDAVDRAQALLVLGSSLAVMSGYRFVRRAAARGTPVAILTLGPTRGDEQATLRLQAPLGAQLTRLVAVLGRPG